jgi:hypothetical protein
MTELHNCNIVVVAKNLNPSIFNQLWLVNNKIFSEDDFMSDSFFTPAAVSVQTKDIQLLIVPDRLQLTFIDITDDEIIINNVLRKIINLLHHTPYIAIGFNFELIIKPKDPNQYPKIAKDIFVSNNNPLAKFFNTDNSRYGITMVNKYKETQLTLNIRPDLPPFVVPIIIRVSQPPLSLQAS